MIKLVVNKKGSKGSLLLAKALKIKRIKCEVYPPTNKKELLISWGHSGVANMGVLNDSMAVARASNKILSFEKFKEHNVPCVPWTTSREEAQRWLDEEYTVVARTKVRAASGRGIVLCKKDHDEMSKTVIYAPLYTRYMNKDAEYRIHIFKGKMIDFAQKKKRRENEELRTVKERLIRSHDNGWVFCRENVVIASKVKDIAIAAVNALGLDFGAVDLIVKGNKVMVLEVNTAPGLEGTTLQAYTNAMKEYINHECERTGINYYARSSNIQRRPKTNQSSNQRRVERQRPRARRAW